MTSELQELRLVFRGLSDEEKEGEDELPEGTEELEGEEAEVEEGELG